MEPNTKSMPVNVHFMFLGESGAPLTGRDADVLAAKAVLILSLLPFLPQLATSALSSLR